MQIWRGVWVSFFKIAIVSFLSVRYKSDGLYCRMAGTLPVFWERGSPDLPACGPRRGCASRPVRPIFINKAFKTLARGQASRGGRRKTSSGAASPGRLARGGEIKARQTSRGSRDVSHNDRDQAGASARSVLVSSLGLRRQAQARSTEASGKGFHISATRPRPAGRQGGGHHGAQGSVTTRAFCRRRLLLSG